MAAHNLLFDEYRNQQTRLAALPALEAQVQQLQREQASWAALEQEVTTLRSDRQSLNDGLQLAHVELTVLRASQRAREERIADLEKRSRELKQRAKVAEEHAHAANDRAQTAQEDLALAEERAALAEAEAAKARVLLEREAEEGEVGDDPIALLLARRRLTQTQKQLAEEQREKAALAAELARMKAQKEGRQDEMVLEHQPRLSGQMEMVYE